MHRSEGSLVLRENVISHRDTAAHQILLTDCTADLRSFTSVRQDQVTGLRLVGLITTRTSVGNKITHPCPR